MAKNLQHIMNSSINPKRLRAFTLLEVLVGMVVSGIVIAATFSTFRIVSGQVLQYQKQTAKSADLSLFASQFTADFTNAEKIIHQAEKEVLLKQRVRSIRYQFLPAFISRSDADHTDTFFVAVSSAAFFLKGEKSEDDNALLDEIKFRFRVGEESFEQVYAHKYAAQEVMREEELTVEKEFSHGH
jgi:prepilin-type N-terminal cleavage/methylation domain-containing protein